MNLLQRIRHPGPRVLGTPIVGTNQHTSLTEAARQMRSADVSALAVYSRDHQHLLGIITERDVTEAVAVGKDLEQTEVSEVMTRHIWIIRGYPSRKSAGKLMKRNDVRHLIVRVPNGDRMISIRDVLDD